MYHGERSIIIDDKYRVRYSDIKTEESDGLKAVKSFAFIASLVSMAKDKILDDQEMKLGQVYPLVMDALMSMKYILIIFVRFFRIQRIRLLWL